MNRASYAYKKARTAFLARHELWGGYYECMACGGKTTEPELDHVQRVGMGGSRERLLDVDNFSLKCHACHQKKDSGLRFKS